MLHYEQNAFTQLSNKTLYQVLQLRNEVFIIEQNTPYQDLDNKDENAIHFLCFNEDTLVGYSRALFDTDKKSMSLGRLITKATHRKQGIAKTLMKHMLTYLDNAHPREGIIISAQTYLEKFYHAFNFVSTDEHYLEDGLPHLKMIRSVLEDSL